MPAIIARLFMIQVMNTIDMKRYYKSLNLFKKNEIRMSCIYSTCNIKAKT